MSWYGVGVIKDNAHLVCTTYHGDRALIDMHYLKGSKGLEEPLES